MFWLSFYHYTASFYSINSIYTKTCLQTLISLLPKSLLQSSLLLLLEFSPTFTRASIVRPSQYLNATSLERPLRFCTSCCATRKSLLSRSNFFRNVTQPVSSLSRWCGRQLFSD